MGTCVGLSCPSGDVQKADTSTDPPSVSVTASDAGFAVRVV